jgi:hypothetical protein
VSDLHSFCLPDNIIIVNLQIDYYLYLEFCRRMIYACFRLVYLWSMKDVGYMWDVPGSFTANLGDEGTWICSSAGLLCNIDVLFIMGSAKV